MTAEQLEELLGIIGCTDDHLHFGAVEELRTLAPSLALRVLAAEKLVEVASMVCDEYDNPDNGRYLRWAADSLRSALTAYREACK